MISPLAYIDSSAKIGKNVTIHPFAYIDKNVEIGDNCTIMPYASILDGTRMGNNNIVYQAAIVGAAPQDFKFKGDETLLIIGDNNTIREKSLSTVQQIKEIVLLLVMETSYWKEYISPMIPISGMTVS